MKRRSPTYRMALEIIAAQLCPGHEILCWYCGQPIDRTALAESGGTIREHKRALALGGDDTPANMALVHPECAKMKTFGSSDSDARGDVQAAAWAKRMNGERPKQSRGRKIKSAGFRQHPTLKRQVGGKVVAR